MKKNEDDEEKEDEEGKERDMKYLPYYLRMPVFLENVSLTRSLNMPV